MPRLLVDISAHGFGHLGQTAPVLDALHAALPGLDITIRSGLTRERLGARIAAPFRHVAAATDFGYVMRNAIDLDLAASAERYRVFHADWQDRVAAEAQWLTASRFDAVLANVAYLPLAGAARAGIAAAALCSLNWADLFAHYYGGQAWAAPIHAQMLAAYRAARVFLRATPGMPMPLLDNLRIVAPICRVAAAQRQALAARLGIDATERWVLVAMGGIAFPLDVARWPRLPGVRWLVPAESWLARDDVTAFDRAPIDFTALLASSDAVLTKPGYGTFVEAACHGIAVLYVPRGDWPEEAALSAWLHANTQALAVGRKDLLAGKLQGRLDAIWGLPRRQRPFAAGVAEVAACLLEMLSDGR